MSRSIGIVAGESFALGVVENTALAGPLRVFADESGNGEALQGMPVEALCDRMRAEIEHVAEGREFDAVGLAFPGMIREGVVEDSPNLQQAKGWNFRAALASSLQKPSVTVHVINDADAMAAGVAALRGALDTVTRLWFLGTGVGFGRYPHGDGVWEGGHSVVSLDPKERFCGCGGVGHLEGIMGTRAMRLRFLDLEPEEIFAHAKEGDVRCASFARMWHRALAAATATSIHQDGPGKFYVCGPNSRFIEVDMLNVFLQEMVKMSPLQGSLFEVIPTSDDLAVLGAAVTAEQAVPARK